ncbi:MAG: histone H1 [Ignavibacteria bacterium]|nr:histone H1 [Ignavibacteria bacterium]
MQKFETLQQLLDGMKPDIEKFYSKGVNSAGGRLRKELNNMRKLAAEIRKDIQTIRNERKPKKSDSPENPA